MVRGLSAVPSVWAGSPCLIPEWGTTSAAWSASHWGAGVVGFWPLGHVVLSSRLGGSWHS